MTDWTPNTGSQPSTGDKPLRILFRNGTEARDRKPAKYWTNWRVSNDDFSIARWAIYEGE